MHRLGARAQGGLRKGSALSRLFYTVSSLFTLAAKFARNFLPKTPVNNGILGDSFCGKIYKRSPPTYSCIGGSFQFAPG